jgi:hypothetical protein
MEYNRISSLVNILKLLKRLILCFMSSQTKFNTAYALIAQIFLRLIIGSLICFDFSLIQHASWSHEIK